MAKEGNMLPPGVAEVVLDTIADWVLVIEHKSNTWVYSNPSCERITGYTAEELQGENTFTSTIFPEEARTEVRRVLERLQEEALVKSVEYEVVHKDGHKVPVNVAVSAVRNEDDSIRYRVAIVRDMSIVQRVLDDLRKDINAHS